uniref:coiled-coil domain-containing protein 3-like n=1 Tax=Gasterosteus aculeatus aculeatus TaxID=481459 RepID=UPI001A99F142|nr:coiled-coil domain-containing protein 3-like [Gasterosteus aculeatus aculeatus]
MENYSYFFFLRMDENYNILPHGINFQDAIFADTSDNRPTFSSLFQFSNSTQGSHSFHVFSPEWGTQEDTSISSPQGASLQPSPSQSRAGQRHRADFKVEGLGVPQPTRRAVVEDRFAGRV